MYSLLPQFGDPKHKQSGINMVDLMMWLVIAALLLAAAIQGIGYYQKAAYLYQMKSDLSGIGSLATGKASQNKGVIDNATVQESVTEGKWSAQVSPTVEGGDTPYIRATHPGVTDFDVLYLFDNCGEEYSIGVNVVPKGGSVALQQCGITAAPPATGGGGSSTPEDLDGDGIPNESDSTPNGETGTGGGGSTPPSNSAEYTLAGWGDNSYGQLGNGTNDSSYASFIGSGIKFSKIDAGYASACGISSGIAYCWGNNGSGQLGIGTGDSVSTPTAVAGLLAGKTVTDISSSQQHACAIADGAAYCWGSNFYGQATGFVNEETPAYSIDSPALVNNGALSGKTLRSIDADGSRTCALDTNGAAYCWGDTQALGDGAPRTGTTSIPVAVAGNLVFTGKLTGFTGHSCGISGGDAYCWGSNDYGRLGTGIPNYEFSATPSKVIGLPAGKVTSLSAGDSHTCAIADAKAYCWGANWGGQVGNGSTQSYDTPPSFTAVPVDASGVLSGVSLTSVSAFSDLTCATNGTGVYCWGEGSAGNGSSYGDYYSPIAVTGEIVGKSVKEISLGSYFATMLTE